MPGSTAARRSARIAATICPVSRIFATSSFDLIRGAMIPYTCFYSFFSAVTWARIFSTSAMHLLDTLIAVNLYQLVLRPVVIEQKNGLAEKDIEPPLHRF